MGVLSGAFGAVVRTIPGETRATEGSPPVLPWGRGWREKIGPCSAPDGGQETPVLRVA